MRITHTARAATLALALTTAALLPACTVAAAGAAVGAAQSGVSIIKKGRVTTVVLAEYPDVVAAVKDAADTLALDERRIVNKDARDSLYYAEPEGGNIAVHVARRTGTVTSLIVDVGATGRADVARLMHAQIIDHLEDADAFLEEWRPGILPNAGE